jgi:hypothetical protein
MMENYEKGKLRMRTVCNTAPAFPKENPKALPAALLISVEKHAVRPGAKLRG